MSHNVSFFVWSQCIFSTSVMLTWLLTAATCSCCLLSGFSAFTLVFSDWNAAQMIEILQSTRPDEIYSYFIYKDLNVFLAIAAVVELEYQAETIRLCVCLLLFCVVCWGFLWIHLAEMTFIDKYTVRIHIGFFLYVTLNEWKWHWNFIFFISWWSPHLCGNNNYRNNLATKIWWQKQKIL